MADLSTLGDRSLGVWTRAQALDVLSAGAIDGLVRTGAWQVLWRGVYADGGYVLDPEQTAWAAVLAASSGTTRAQGSDVRAVACGRTAARVWRWPLIDDADPATGAEDWRFDDVAVARRLPRQAYGGRWLVPRRSTLARDELIRLPSGLWVTTPLRTLADCAPCLSVEALVCAADAALHRGQLDRSAVHAALVQRRGSRGAVSLRSAAEAADGRAESPGETLARLLLRPVLPELEPQVELFDSAGRLVARFDLGDRRARLAVEADGKVAHAGDAMVAKDRRRDRATEALGWHTERVTWYELRRQQRAFVERVVQRHASLAASARAA